MPALRYVTPPRRSYEPAGRFRTFAPHQVYGYSPDQLTRIEAHTAAQRAAWTMRNAEDVVRDARAAYVQARRDIGDANRGGIGGLHVRNPDAHRRREARSIAFRTFNAARRRLIAAEHALAAAQAALAGLAG